MAFSDEPVFDDKKLSDIFSDIYRNTDSKRAQINTFVSKLVQLIRTPDDAAVIGPVVQGFLDTSVRNDEHIVRLAQIVQRMATVSLKGSESDILLTEAEKNDLLKGMSGELNKLKTEVDEFDIDRINK